jgi:hypothetical protein
VKTIKEMLKNPPTNVRKLLMLPEFARNRSNIRGYEEIMLQILREYERVITNLPSN